MVSRRIPHGGILFKGGLVKLSWVYNYHVATDNIEFLIFRKYTNQYLCIFLSHLQLKTQKLMGLRLFLNSDRDNHPGESCGFNRPYHLTLVIFMSPSIVDSIPHSSSVEEEHTSQLACCMSYPL